MPLVQNQRVTPDLFESAADGSDFAVAFAHWLSEERRARPSRHIKLDSTVQVYSSIWEALTRFAVAQKPPVALETLSAEQLLRFIESRDGESGPGSGPSAQHVWRMLNLVGRVLEADAARAGRTPSDAAAILLASRPDWQYANAAAAKPMPDALSAADAKQLVTFLSSVSQGARGDPERSWQDLRNRAAVALHLGAGLTPSDVRELRTSSVVVAGGLRNGEPWKISVPPHATTAARETPIAAWGARLLRRWLDVRTEAQIAGDFLLPARRAGQPWGKVAHYGAVLAVLESAGIDPGAVSGGAYRLRHTFALRQLKRGRSPRELAAWLGVSETVVNGRYMRGVFAPVVDVA